MKSVSLVDRRGYLTVVLELEGEAGLVVRKPEGLRDWYNTVQKMVKDSKARVMLTTEQFWNKSKAGVGGGGEGDWLWGQRTCRSIDPVLVGDWILQWNTLRLLTALYIVISNNTPAGYRPLGPD